MNLEQPRTPEALTQKYDFVVVSLDGSTVVWHTENVTEEDFKLKFEEEMGETFDGEKYRLVSINASEHNSI